jgi:hypothetical protein
MTGPIFLKTIKHQAEKTIELMSKSSPDIIASLSS